MRPSPRPPRARPAALAALGLVLLACPAPGLRAQYYGGTTYYGGVGYVNWPLVQFPAVEFPLVQFPLVQFPAYMGITNYFDGYAYGNPYTGWDYGAAADSYRLSKYAMSSARYTTDAAALATASAANGLIDQQAWQEMAWRNASAAPPPTGRYAVRTGRAAPSGARESGRTRLLQLTSRDGDVLWPLTAPARGELREKRRAANEAIKAAVRQARAPGGAHVDTVVEALRALHAYAEPAADALRRDAPDQLGPFLDFLTDLDSGLRALSSDPLPDDAKAPPPPAPPAPDAP